MYTLQQHTHAHTRSKDRDKYTIYTDIFIASYSYKGILYAMHYFYTDKHTESNANIIVILKRPHTYTEPYMLSWFTLCTQWASIAFSFLSCTDEASDSDGENNPWWAAITFREDSFNRTHLKFRVAMQNKSAFSCTGAAIKGICGEARRREGLKGNKRWDLNVGSRKSDTFHHVRDGVHTSTWALYSHIHTLTEPWWNCVGFKEVNVLCFHFLFVFILVLWRGYFVYVDVIFHIVQICPSRISLAFLWHLLGTKLTDFSSSFS